MHRIRIVLRRIPLCLAAGAGIAAGWLTHRAVSTPGPPGTASDRSAGMPDTPPAGLPAPRPVSIEGSGSQAFASLAAALSDPDTSPAAFAATARQWLREGRYRESDAMWGLLLTHWAAADGSGMLDFVEREAPAAEREWLLPRSWRAWGSADPAAAFAAGRNSAPDLITALMDGIADAAPRLAAEYALQVPNAQSVIGTIARRIAAGAPELVDRLMQRATAPAASVSLQKAQLESLAASDPAKAFEAATRMRITFGDSVPQTIATIASRDPEKAASLVDTMPSSRSRALAVVTLAGVWTARDPEAALEWIRSTWSGPVRNAALVQAAAARGSSNPAEGLEILAEVDWEESAGFFSVRDPRGGATITGREEVRQTSPTRTAASLLQQLYLLDPGEAEAFLHERIPQAHHAEVASLAGLQP